VKEVKRSRQEEEGYFTFKQRGEPQESKAVRIALALLTHSAQSTQISLAQ